MTRVGTRNMAFGEVNTYIIVVHNKDAPTDEEWREYLEFNRGRGLSHGRSSRYLIVTEGGVPTSAQQRSLQDAITPVLQKNPSAMPSAVVTPSTFVRGVVAAMNVHNRILEVFSPDEMERSYAFLGIPPAYIGEVEAMIASLKTQLRP